MRLKLAVFAIVIVYACLCLYAAMKTGQDVHWDLRKSNLDKDIAWPSDNKSDFCTYEHGAIHTATVDLPGLPEIKTTPLLFVNCYRNGSAVNRLEFCQINVTRDEAVAQAHAFERLMGWPEQSLDWWVKAEQKQFASGGLMEIQRKDWFYHERPLETWATIGNNCDARSEKPYSLMITIWWRNDDPMYVGVRDPSQEDAGVRALEAIAGDRDPDPRFDVDRLRGKTPDEVVKDLGQPTDDPRLSTTEPWTPESERRFGPLIFTYGDKSNKFKDNHYGIVFEHGKVAYVVATHK